MSQAWQDYRLALRQACGTLERYVRDGEFDPLGQSLATQMIAALEHNWGDPELSRQHLTSLVRLFGDLRDAHATPSKAVLDTVGQWIDELEEVGPDLGRG